MESLFYPRLDLTDGDYRVMLAIEEVGSGVHCLWLRMWRDGAVTRREGADSQVCTGALKQGGSRECPACLPGLSGAVLC